MKSLRVIGLSRACQYSPNLVDNDAAIFGRVTQLLEQKGWHIHVCSEEAFVASPKKADVIYTMARDSETVSMLCQMEDEGVLVINSGYGIRSCARQPLTESLIKAGIPFPVSKIVRTDQPLGNDSYPCWIKRGNSHAIVKEDVSFARCRADAERILNNFHERGIITAVISEHLDGDLIKFYGVLHTDFFDWHRANPDSHSKFGLEKINGIPNGYGFDALALKRWSDEAARVLQVPIYGGDCVVAADGSFKIIDFNDWPSFSCCRERAANAIADCIYSLAKRKYNDGFKD